MKDIQYKLTCLGLCIVLIGIQSLDAQVKFSFFDNTRSDAGISYNFFLGNDADAFSTTINGFGSGFIFDIFTGRYSVDFLTFGCEAVNISLGAGLAISKYRFSENLIFEKTNDEVIAVIDPNPDHDYGTGFFSYGKSKLVYGSVYFPVNLNISVKELYFSAGVLLDRYVSGKFKLKYKENDKKQIIVERNNTFNDFFLNKTKYGINALIMHKPTGLGLGFTYMFTPFFEEDKGPSINETRVSLTYDFSGTSHRKKTEKKPEEIDL